ncbi:lysozyme [Vibrio sp. 10N.261.55.A7]|uniref:lysozyme n=1 Tax=Vibrio sp. 10N.261.55.A7 TaxID=1880851 RepID=UPI000C836C32|nr:lysozyme [Vibrio sp. 10N.261.55.A7]PMJ92860.1 lysozyme [Vibrio sp. 10N.261.55.A7]
MKLTNKIICSVAAVIGLVTGSAVLNSQPVGEVVIQNEVVTTLRVSPMALEIIGNAEGCRKSPYVCPAGLVTNGIGNTQFSPNETVSHEQIAKDWVKNIANAEKCVRKAEQTSGVTMTQGQFDAFTSFAFNTGCTRFRRNPNQTSTQIYKHILTGNYQNACDQLPRWVYGGGVKLPGLITRRGLEHDRCHQVD